MVSDPRFPRSSVGVGSSEGWQSLVRVPFVRPVRRFRALEALAVPRPSSEGLWRVPMRAPYPACLGHSSRRGFRLLVFALILSLNLSSVTLRAVVDALPPRSGSVGCSPQLPSLIDNDWLLSTSHLCFDMFLSN